MSWLPEDFFIGHPGQPEQRPNRPLGQGDVFDGVPVAVRTGIKNGQAGATATIETVIVVASSCGMRKNAGGLNDLIHVAPVKRLESLAPNWGDPWAGQYKVLPLPGLMIGEPEEPAAANLGRIGLCSLEYLDLARRRASVSLSGMQTLKCRLSMYFTRAPISPNLFVVASHEEWHELDLWERWKNRTGSEDGFQGWLDGANLDFPERTRRDTIYDDLVGIAKQLDEGAV
jgi:hypothetical protein